MQDGRTRKTEKGLGKTFIRDIYLFPSPTFCFSLMQKKKNKVFPWGILASRRKDSQDRIYMQRILEISLRYVGAFDSDHLC